MAKSHLELVGPTAENRTVRPLRRKNAELRTREYLTDAEVAQLIDATKANRYGQRDATMILVAYRHGLRVSELVDLRWEQIDFNTAMLHVRRVKKGSPSTHPILGDELRAVRRLAREQDPKSPFVFTRSVVRHSQRRALPGWWSALVRMPVALRSQTRAMTRGLCRPTWAIAISSTRCVTPSCRRIGSRTSGARPLRDSELARSALCSEPM